MSPISKEIFFLKRFLNNQFLSFICVTGGRRKYVLSCPFQLAPDHNVYPYVHHDPIRLKGVVTNYGEGGATKREGGAREVLPLRKGGTEKVLAILKGGHKKFWGKFYVVV